MKTSVTLDLQSNAKQAARAVTRQLLPELKKDASVHDRETLVTAVHGVFVELGWDEFAAQAIRDGGWMIQFPVNVGDDGIDIDLLAGTVTKR